MKLFLLLIPNLAFGLTYNKDIRPIFSVRCSECHNQTTMPNKNWMDYKIAFENRLKIKFRVTAKNMPPFREITEQEISMISKWVDEGAKE